MSDPRTFLDGRVILHAGDCREVLRGMADNSVDSVVTDPPYHLQSIVKRFGGKNAAPAQYGTDGAFARASGGFMGKQWDGGDIAFQPELWAEVLRVLKPGGYILAFSGCRTYHRMACAIEDAGCITHPMFCWAFGQGFPKSHSLNKQLRDKVCRCERAKTISQRDMRSVQCANVPAPECIAEECDEVLFDCVQEPDLQGAMLWSEQSEVSLRGGESSLERWRYLSESPRQLCEREICSMPSGIDVDGKVGRLRNGASVSDGEMVSENIDALGMRSPRGSQSAEQCEKEFDAVAGQSESQERGAWPICDRCGKPIIDADGWFYGTQSLKPAVEPIYFGQKPFSEKTGAANVLRWGTGAINVGACRVPKAADDRHEYGVSGDEPSMAGGGVTHGNMNRVAYEPDALGRWPANFLHDNSEEVLACFPDREAGGSKDNRGVRHNVFEGATRESVRGDNFEGYDDSGSAARFFASFPEDEDDPAAKRIIYTPKADQDSRLGSRHPCVKPLKLIQYLVRLITPLGGTVLDCFAGTGTTGEAAFREGFRAILIEREAEYIADIERRMNLVMEGPVTRAHAGTKARGRPVDNGPLFGGSDETLRHPRPTGCIRVGAEGPFGKDRFDEAAE